MGRTFENRKGAMMKRSLRLAKAFTRAGREIAISVKEGGPIPENNPALRRAIQNARSVDMPKDKIQSAIDKASGAGATDYQILFYEGYAPHGVALMVETTTDNPTRTIANVRSAFKKGNGSIGTSGSVAFMFERQGVFKLDPETIEMDLEELELELIDHGLEELERDTDDDDKKVIVLRCAFTDFGALQSGIETLGIEPKSSGSEFTPSNTVQLTDEQIDEVMALVDRLEEDDDVSTVYHTLA